MDLFIKKNSDIDTSFDAVIVKMGNLTQLEYVAEKVANANSFLIQGNDYYIPFGETIDLEAEKKKIAEGACDQLNHLFNKILKNNDSELIFLILKTNNANKKLRKKK